MTRMSGKSLPTAGRQPGKYRFGTAVGGWTEKNGEFANAMFAFYGHVRKHVRAHLSLMSMFALTIAESPTHALVESDRNSMLPLDRNIRFTSADIVSVMPHMPGPFVKRRINNTHLHLCPLHTPCFPWLNYAPSWVSLRKCINSHPASAVANNNFVDCCTQISAAVYSLIDAVLSSVMPPYIRAIIA